MTQNNLRKNALEILEAGLKAIKPEKFLNEKIVGKFKLKSFEKIYVFGAGKGVRFLAKRMEQLLGDKVAGGIVTDIEILALKKIEVLCASHPLPDKNSLTATQKIIRKINSISPIIKSSNHLIILLFTGGGSSLFTWPIISIKRFGEINDILIKSGANIGEINIVRKHLDRVKGGELAKIIYPLKCLTFLISDVPGNDLSIIASGPTIYDKTTISDAQKIIDCYNFPKTKLIETPKDKNFFKNITNYLLATNKIALEAMRDKAKSLGYKPQILTDRLTGSASDVGQKLLKEIKLGQALIAGGETEVNVKGKGKGGRNTHLCLAVLPYIPSDTCFASIDSDGQDNTDAAGAVVDIDTLKKAKKLRLMSDNSLANFDSYNFFQKTGDLIKTGPLPVNVGDLTIVLKKC